MIILLLLIVFLLAIFFWNVIFPAVIVGILAAVLVCGISAIIKKIKGVGKNEEEKDIQP